MRVKSVEYEMVNNTHYNRYVIEFEHNGVTWFKFFPINLDELSFKNFLNSVIDDTLARHTQWDK